MNMCLSPQHLQQLCFVSLQRTYESEEFFTSSEDSLLGRHRNSATISASSSTATFSAGSTDSRIVNIHKHQQYNKCRENKMSVSKQRELNLLITTPQVPELSTGGDISKNKVTLEESSIQDNQVYIPQTQLKDTDSSESNAEPSVASQVQINWFPQVSSSFAFFV
jgi:hypothetical protein